MSWELDIAKLWRATETAMAATGLSARKTAAAVGVSPSTLSRMKAGQKPDADGLVSVLAWLGADLKDFTLTPDGQVPVEPREVITTKTASSGRAHPDCGHCRHWETDPNEVSEAVRAARVLAGLGGLLFETRRKRGLSQREVARQADVSFATVSRLEAGTTNVETLIALRLIDWIENPPPPEEETDPS